MIVATPIKTEEKKVYSLEEYLALEENAEEKHEYHDGEIIKMTGGTTNHNILALKIASLFLSFLEEENYQIYIGDVRLWIEEYHRYTYPDVMVIEGEQVYEGNGKNTVINPLLIVEVLSNSTKDYDQNDKFDSYRTLPSLREYILIDQYKYYVKQFTKTPENKWLLTDYIGEDATVKLESINLEISLKTLYKKVNFQFND
ncbi:Uma2 family endonuclease [Geminocystis sp. GBBB08]|uniref:Uma2 family endonuclease n=1 Tax=Geminocystis sp. GBBB08 TaxID=2604140 RepID=UPI0027E2ECC7|nr:Uma2 family endonuclease [Geminocystis sp. GBBB08]MBL1210607.1 Uma2 family endonuclease [Geminocystis sp. GBBB08]